MSGKAGQSNPRPRIDRKMSEYRERESHKDFHTVKYHHVIQLLECCWNPANQQIWRFASRSLETRPPGTRNKRANNYESLSYYCITTEPQACRSLGQKETNMGFRTSSHTWKFHHIVHRRQTHATHHYSSRARTEPYFRRLQISWHHFFQQPRHSVLQVHGYFTHFNAQAQIEDEV